MKLKITLIASLFTAIALNASTVNDTIILKSENYSEKITRDLDSLVNSWYVKLALKDLPYKFENDSMKHEYPDSLYLERLNKLNSIINLRYNGIIRNHIHVYTVK